MKNIKQFRQFLNESLTVKDFDKVLTSITGKFSAEQKKIKAKLNAEVIKNFKGKEISGLTGYQDPEYPSRGMIEPNETVFVEDAYVEFDTAVFELEPVIIFVVKGNDYYMSIY
jgi:roadblock/LC7 domain-containing protein